MSPCVGNWGSSRHISGRKKAKSPATPVRGSGASYDAELEAVMRWGGVVALCAFVGCNSSVETLPSGAEPSAGGGGSSGSVTVAEGQGGYGGTAVAASSVGDGGAPTVGIGGSGGYGGASCVDPDPPWTCHQGDEYYTPLCNDAMPEPCGSEWCPDPMQIHCKRECMLWEVNMATGECHIGGMTFGPLMCGPGGNTWGCQFTGSPDAWSCCVEGGF